MAKIENFDESLAWFENAAISHEEATNQGDCKKANESYYKLVKAVDFLKKQNNIDELLVFLNHSSDGVKCWAATYLLPVKEKEAIATLQEIAKGKGFNSLDAKTTLSEWQKGNLKV